VRGRARASRGRRWAVGLALLLSALWLLVACGDDTGGQEEEGTQQEEAQQQEEPVVGEFVGEILDTGTFVSLVAEKPQRAEDAREVGAYLSDGKQLSEWFTGRVSGDELQLVSENGVQLDSRLFSDLALGTITLLNGDRLNFAMVYSTYIRGFYPVSVPPEGPLSATSWSGAHLQGSRTGEEIIGTITPPDGEKADFVISEPTLEEGDHRWIVYTGGGEGGEWGLPRIKGAQRDAESTGVIDPSDNLKKPGFVDSATNFLLDPGRTGDGQELISSAASPSTGD
jgi:hypothetical protein